MLRTIRTAAMAAALVGASHAMGAEAAGKDGLRVVASIPPVAGLVTELLPEGSTLTTLAPPGQSEHGFELTPGMVEAIAGADIVFLVGLGMEPQVEEMLDAIRRNALSVSHAHFNVPDTVIFAEAARVRPPGGLEEGPAAPHDHDESDATHHHGPDPHLWLDPSLAGAFVAAASEAILARLTALNRADAQTVANLKAAKHEALNRMTKIEGAYMEALEPFKGAWLVTQHDAFGRLAERHGLRTLALTAGGEGSEPSPATLVRIAGLAKDGSVRAVFTEPQSDPKAMERLAKAAGAKVLTLDPLGDGDWFSMMRKNLEALKEGLAAPKAE